MGTAVFHPRWWNEQQHGNAWSRAKDALRRDFEQTKNDLTPGAPDLNQDVGDTVKQVMGTAPIPRPGEKTPASKGEMKSDAKGSFKKGMKFEDVEGPLSYGYAARMQYENKFPKWDDKLETTLRGEWSSGNNSQKFDEVVPYIKRGFDAPHTK